MHLNLHGHILRLPDGRAFKCAIGKNGIGVKQGEGDHITPIGTWPLREVLYRADKINAPDTNLSVSVINQKDIWIDAPNDPFYNTRATGPVHISHECLWRDDDVYDIIVPLGYNDNPVVPGKGSAIFMHIARNGYTPTEGCVALSQDDLRAVLKDCQDDSTLTIHES